MKFESTPQRRTYLKIFEWMEELFGEHLSVYDDSPRFGVSVGSAHALTAVLPFQEDAIISTRAYVVTGAPPSLEFYTFLLQQNHRMTFGSFGVDEQGDVFLEHTIMGETCDKAELSSSVLAVALLADDFDDEITRRWGGRRAVDRAD